MALEAPWDVLSPDGTSAGVVEINSGLDISSDALRQKKGVLENDDRAKAKEARSRYIVLHTCCSQSHQGHPPSCLRGEAKKKICGLTFGIKNLVQMAKWNSLEN